MDNNGKEIYLFGIRPTNQLQLGNFLLIKQFLHLQEKKCVEIRIMIADLHYVESQEKVINLTKMLAACGLKITQVKFFVQSMLPYHTQLAFLLLNFVTIGELERMIQFKQKKQTKLKDENNTFLLFYPVLMAADIIIQRANYVLIGEDQKQHFELTKKIIKRINYHLSQKISFPKIFFVKHPKIKDLKNPEKKMSKSSPEGAIFLNEDLNSIWKKIKSAKTDSKEEIIFQSEKETTSETVNGISNLILIYSLLTGKEVNKIEKEFKTESYFYFKKQLFQTIKNTVVNFQIKFKALRDEEVNFFLEKNNLELRKETRKYCSLILKELQKKKKYHEKNLSTK